MLAEAPKNAFADELDASMAQGADLLAAMVRLSVFGQQQLPPPEMFSWYVMNLAYKLVAEEHLLVYKLEGASQEAFDATNDELKGVMLILGKQKMFGLQAQVEEVLRIRSLHLPQ